MPPTHLVPTAKRPIGRYLSFLEREDIAMELAKGTGIRAIARLLGRLPSTISREMRRNAATGSLTDKGRLLPLSCQHCTMARRPGCLSAKN